MVTRREGDEEAQLYGDEWVTRLTMAITSYCTEILNYNVHLKHIMLHAIFPTIKRHILLR